MSEETIYQEILYEVDAPVATITMNRPEQLNAFTTRMLAEVAHAVDRAEKDESVVGIVLTGAGRGFCAGMDMMALSKASKGEGGATDDLAALQADPGDSAVGDEYDAGFLYLLTVRKPILAAVNGACAGLGFCFALLADMRFVEPQTKITAAFSQRGLIAEHGSSWLLPRLIGTGKALDLLWSSRKINGEEAFSMGLAERLSAPGESAQEAANYIRQLAASASPTSIMVMKQQVYRHLQRGAGESMLESIQLMSESLTREDFKEGVASFLERRQPEFKRVGEA